MPLSFQYFFAALFLDGATNGQLRQFLVYDGQLWRRNAKNSREDLDGLKAVRDVVGGDDNKSEQAGDLKYELLLTRERRNQFSADIMYFRLTMSDPTEVIPRAGHKIVKALKR